MGVNMFKKIFLFFSFMILIINFSSAKEKTKINKKKLTCLNLRKNLDDFDFNKDKIFKRVKKDDLIYEKPRSKNGFSKVFSSVQSKINEKIYKKNLKAAESFLENNLKSKDVIEIENNKIQYKILKEGLLEDKAVKSYNTPIVKITAKDLNGKVFFNEERAVDLNEDLTFLKNAIIGMKKNEKRQIYVHPDLCLGTEFSYLSSLLIFDVEILCLETPNIYPNGFANSDNFYR